MPMFEKIKLWYEMGLWTLAKVRKAVEKNVITPEEFELITGGKYE